MFSTRSTWPGTPRAQAVRAVRAATLLPLRLSVAGVRLGVRLAVSLPDLPDAPDLPAPRVLDLPGRGRLPVVDSGAPYPGAPTVVLFHGLASTAALCWFGAFEQLRQRYRVVLFDQRWHGSGLPAERFDLAACADDTAAVLDALKVRRAILVGYSMGGALAQVCWQRHADRVAGLVLCSTAATWKGNLAEAAFFPVLGAVADRIALRGAAAIGRAAAGRSDVPYAAGDLRGWALGELRGVSPWSLPEVLGALGRFDARPWLPTIDAPCAVVVTERDRAIPAARQRAMAAAVPGARVLTAPGGHTSLVLDVDRWLPVFLAAVDDVAGRAGAAGSGRRAQVSGR